MKKRKKITNKTQSKMKDLGPIPEKEEEKKEEKEKGKPGRPTILTPELRSKLIQLFEKHFFIGIVAAEADIYRERIFEWERELIDFRTDITHARDKWIQQQMELLDQYAKDKREKDWRALKYKLSIADVEYNDKKYLRDELGKRETPQITIIFNRKDIETSKQEALKIIGDHQAKEETVSLLPFKKEEKGEKKGKGTKKEDKEEKEDDET